MILVDTSIWIDHLSQAAGSPLPALLEDVEVLMHPFIIGELAMGSLSRRHVILDSLMALPTVKTVSMDEALHLLHQTKLYGIGIGYIDLHLLASTRLTEGASLWTRDRRLIQACAKADVPAFSPY